MKERFSARKKIAGVVVAAIGLTGVAGCGEVSGQTSHSSKLPAVANYLITGTTSERQADGTYKTTLDLAGCVPYSDQGVSGKDKKAVGAGIYYGPAGSPDGLITLGTGYRAEANGINLTGAAKVMESGQVEDDNSLYGDKIATLAAKEDIGADAYSAKVARTFGVACTREVRIDNGAADYRTFDPSKGLNGEVSATQPTEYDNDTPFYGEAIVNVTQEQNGKPLITIVAQPHEY